jgi:hypothetical protein
VIFIWNVEKVERRDLRPVTGRCRTPALEQRLRCVNNQCPTQKTLPVTSSNTGFRQLLINLDEAEAARVTGKVVNTDIRSVGRKAIAPEPRQQLILTGFVRQISYEDSFHQRCCVLLPLSIMREIRDIPAKSHRYVSC